MQERRFMAWLNTMFAMAGIGWLALLSISFLHLMAEPLKTYMSYIIACCFWGSLLVEVFATWQCARYRKQLRKSGRAEKNGWKDVGILSFGRNREGTIADLGIVCASLMVAVLIVMKVNTVWLVIGSVLLWFLAIQLHCLLNGKNYRYMKLLNNKREKKE